MKTLLALLALTPAVAFLAFGESALAEGSERWPDYYAPSHTSPRGCTEGRTELFLEYGGSVDKRVWRTCKNGAFVAAPAPVVRKGCKEGAQELFIETDATNGRDVRVVKTCTRGVWL